MPLFLCSKTKLNLFFALLQEILPRRPADHLNGGVGVADGAADPTEGAGVGGDGVVAELAGVHPERHQGDAG